MFVFAVIFLIAQCNAKVELYLFSHEYPTEKIQLNHTSFSLINTTNPLKFIIHGWGESSERAYYQEMTDAYLIRSNYNIIQVDWRELAGQLYLLSVVGTRTVGAIVGKIIVKLNKEFNIPLENVHVVGHSLGSHVAGFCGKQVWEITGSRIHRISALDPAGPGFEELPYNERLNSKDAEMVDVTHTDIRYNGFEKPLGTVDFYANGGHRPQPGCELFNVDFSQTDPIHIAFCSHTKSYQYFIEAVNTDAMVATKCKSFSDYIAGECNNNEKIVYGEDTPFQSRGVYYFNTNDAKSFAIKQ